MSNIMDMVKTRIKTSRNGFDLSKKNAFTAKVGELLPVYCKEVMAGDMFEINVQAFTRTMPVSTAAYTRVREYYDFYFVPTSLLWNRYLTFLTSMGHNNQQADGIKTNTVIGDQHPYFTVRQVLQYLDRMDGETNYFGYSRADLSRKLLDYLNYGDYHKADIDFPSRVNAALNPFPLLAYQKIYMDYFRNSNWEDNYAPACNINYVRGNGDLNLPISELYTFGSGIDGDVPYNMFDLRYCNWNKDYFMGLLPNSQFGDVATVDFNNVNITNASPIELYGKPSVEQISTTSSGALSADGQYGWTLSRDSIVNIAKAIGVTPENLSSRITVLSLRLAEYKQRYKEVVQSNYQDVKHQLNAQFGVDVSNAYSERCQYLGGNVSTLDINEVVNQNLSEENTADIRGKGVGVHEGYIKAKFDVPGYIMCIYHAVPLLDYAITGIARQNLKTMRMDYAQPAFDKVGMVSVPLIELSNSKFIGIDFDENPLLGYAPRYIDYKTDIDEVHGGFKNGELDAWVAPVSDEYITQYLQSLPTYLTGSSPLTYPFFKVNPAFLNPIFVQDADSTLVTDQLLINCAFDVKAVRNLDVNGLPY